MSEIKTSEVLDILNKIKFINGQRAGRELWMYKPIEVQNKDLADFNRDIEIIKEYIESKNSAMERIVERLEEEQKGYICDEDDYCEGAYNAYRDAILVVKEEGGIE